MTATLTPTGTPIPTSTPTPTTTPAVSPTLTLTGSVALRPVQRSVDPPHMYVVVLDVSGSMALNFNGQAIIDGQVRQCGAGADAALNTKRAEDAPVCEANFDDLWFPVEERRIYIVKRALMQFVDLLGPNDRMQIVAFSGVGVTTVGSAAYGDTTGKAILKQAVLDAGKTSGDPFLVRGGAPIATGLYRARQVLASAPTTAPNGQTYEQVVLMMTDSVANFYRDTANGRYVPSNIPVGWENKAQDQYPRCEISYSERVDCQAGFADTTMGKIARPLTAMVNEGIELQKTAEVYVVALAGVDATGLPFVASIPEYPWFAPANQGSSLPLVLSAIYDMITSVEQPEWVDQIDAPHAPDPAILPGVDATTFGVVTLKGPGSVTRTAPIQTDPASGTLAYGFEGLAPGSYTLSAWVGYKGNDGITRRYELLTDASRVEIGLSLTITLPPTVRQDVFLVR
ncbi:MAG: hypothetical protein OHK0022_02220 [Roseiflexaceae bacterium]